MLERPNIVLHRATKVASKAKWSSARSAAPAAAIWVIAVRWLRPLEEDLP